MKVALSYIVALLRALRAYQWTKNLLVFAALIFAQQFTEPGQLLRSTLAFIAFCAASSTVYLFNDMLDLEKDRKHPEKCQRPLASGQVSIPMAIFMLVLLLVGSLWLAWSLNRGFFAALALYQLLMLVYTLGLKNAIIIDVLTIAIGFVIRAMAGALALEVDFSNWLVVCTLFLALFLALSKRRHEIGLMAEEAHTHREVLRHYSVDCLDAMIGIVAGAALITYTIYTCSPDVVERVGTDKLYLTLPFVVYGLFRYFHLLHQEEKLGGGDPSKTLITDWPIGVTVVFWALTCTALIYGGDIMARWSAGG